MALTYQSTQTQNWTSASSVTITKPTSLAVGELMVCFITAQVTDISSIDFTTGGWTEINSNDDGTECWRAGYKLATSGDVAASNFSFGLGGTVYGAGSITRITDGIPDSGVNAKQKVTTAATTTANTLDITPSVPNSLLLFYGWHAQNTPGTHSNYAIATSNPSWTEAYDFSSTAPTPDYANFLAYAVRPETTSTGDFSVDCTATGGSLFAFAVAISPVASVTVSPAVLTATFSVQTPTVTGGAVVSPAVIALTANIQAPTVTTPTPDWINEDANSTISVINEDKT